MLYTVHGTAFSLGGHFFRTRCIKLLTMCYYQSMFSRTSCLKLMRFGLSWKITVNEAGSCFRGWLQFLSVTRKLQQMVLLQDTCETLVNKQHSNMSALTMFSWLVSREYRSVRPSRLSTPRGSTTEPVWGIAATCVGHGGLVSRVCGPSTTHYHGSWRPLCHT